MDFHAPLNITGARFIGRETDIDGLDALFADGRRLVTVWATAGMGKTRLATEYALRMRSSGGTVAFCDLTECRSAADVVGAVAAALGSSFASGDLDGEIQRIGRVLAGRPRQWVVLDNFEQVVEVAAETVARWVSIATRCRFLVTSRERLRLRGEASYELSPLSLPSDAIDAEASDAVALFCDRARDLDPDFTIDAENREALIQLVRRLEGIPLAIELAAARVDVLGVWGLLERLSERLLVLGAGQRDLSPRQATLRGAIAWSWDLLDGAERACLAHSSVFQGGFTLEAAEAVLVVGDDERAILDVLQSLRDKSLLRVGRENRSLRFSHYESVRRFARAALRERDEYDAATERHADFFAHQGD